VVLCEPLEAQGPIVNAAELQGKIVVVERGGCTFSHKVLECQVNGATAVIVCNTLDGEGVHMTPDPGSPEVNIPSFMISKMDGYFLKAALPGANASILNKKFGKSVESPKEQAASPSPVVGSDLADVTLSSPTPPLNLSDPIFASAIRLPAEDNLEATLDSPGDNLEADIADVLGDMEDLLGADGDMSPLGSPSGFGDAGFDLDDALADDSLLLDDDAGGLL